MGMILLQLVTLSFIAKLPWSLVIGLAYCFGGVINHSLMLGNKFLSVADHILDHILFIIYLFKALPVDPLTLPCVILSYRVIPSNII